MTDEDKQTFSDGMTALGIALGQAVDQPMRAVYWQFLRDLDLDDYQRAVNEAGRSLKWFPKPSELRELTGESVKADAAEAWGAVRLAMDRHDYTTSVDFGPLVNAVVHNIGGWRQLCDTSIPDLEWRRKKFEEVYAAYRMKPTDEIPRGGEYLKGAFGGPPVRIQIGPVKTPLALPEPPMPTNGVVRDLANAKSYNGSRR